MGPVTIRECSVTEFCASDNLDELFSEYAAESSIEGLPAYKVNFEIIAGNEDEDTLRFILKATK